MQQQTEQDTPQSLQDYITIVAPSIGEVMRRFKDSGMAANGYAITGPIVRQTVAYAAEDGTEDPFADRPMTVATFARCAG